MTSDGLADNRRLDARPFFSICIPQYNRTDFLIAACETFSRQKFRDFEVCVSDDCSNDGKDQALLAYLQASGLSYIYARTSSNLRYDANLRNAIALSRGRYLLLMGNDDGLIDGDALQVMHDVLVRHQPVAAAITNYRERSSGRDVRRMTSTGILGQGEDVAVSIFRRYSFVSGVILEGEDSRKEAMDGCDGSEMYQMYLGTRLVAGGGRFLSIDRILIDKDLQIPGQFVDSYRLKVRLNPCPIVERPLPMGRLFEIIARGLEPYACSHREKSLMRIGRQLYGFIYPYWIVEYRRIQSWRYAFGVLLGFRPSCIARGLNLSWFSRVCLWLMYLMMGAAALTTPIALFDTLQPRLFAMAKRVRSVRR